MQFSLIQSHPNSDPYWALKIKCGDFSTAMKFHGHLTKQLNIKIGKDPHFKAALEKEDPISVLRHPAMLGAKWIVSIGGLFERGNDVFVNRNGGMLTGANEISTVDQEWWPVDKVHGEKITISKYTPGKHYYISSDKRIFLIDKFDSEKETKAFLEAHCQSAKIFWINPRRLERDGD